MSLINSLRIQFNKIRFATQKEQCLRKPLDNQIGKETIYRLQLPDFDLYLDVIECPESRSGNSQCDAVRLGHPHILHNLTSTTTFQSLISTNPIHLPVILPRREQLRWCLP